MRAAQVTALGAAPVPADVDEPRAEEGEEVVSVEAVALNPLDLSVGAGRFYGGHPTLPYEPGCEAAGRLDDGSLVYLFGAGRGTAVSGFLAERVVVPGDLPLRLPEGTEPAVAAGLGIAGIAGWVPVAWRARITPEDRVLVLGATGTVGRVALQAARALGARTVVGASRTPAEGVVGLDEIGEAFGGEGFTVCIDPLWGTALADALAFAAPRARIVHLGQSAGAEAPLRSADVRGKQLEILGHSNFGLTAEERNRAYLELLGEVRAGRIDLGLETYPLDRVGEAWARQGSPGRGKVVVTIGRET